MVKDPGIESQRTVTYKPSSMSFKEYDKKMRSFRPDLQYWEDVLTKEKEWEKKDANNTNVYSADDIKSLQATDRIARSVYVLKKRQMCTRTMILHMRYVKHYEPVTRIRNNGDSQRLPRSSTR